MQDLKLLSMKGKKADGIVLSVKLNHVNLIILLR